MAVINFPDSPSDGATQTVGGITYTYSSSKGYWTAAASSGGGGGGGASVTTDDSAPSSPSDGDLWYDTDDGGMFVYYEDTDSSQWVEVIGSQGATGTTGADGGAGVASVYATIDALPLTGNTQGDMAHVTANNTLYFWNGSGWYKIALINTNPSISGVSSSYALANDGTATTVTVTASDPEGLPITYSIASDTSGNIATVSQGTGASTNVFTITPSTNTAYAGSFSLTFRASDGVNIATAPATFTLQFIIANSNYTTSLITTSANAGTNSTFTDSSSNSHTVTAGGNATQTAFSPYRHGGYSTYFDGSGDYLHAPDSSTLDLPADFTIEFWMYREGDTSGTYQSILGGNGSTSNGWNFYITNSNNVLSFFHTSFLITGPAIEDHRWYHVALTRSGTTLTMYVDGTSVGTATTSTSFDQNTANAGTRIGYDIGANGYFHGYLTDVRVVQGTAVYTAAFTPPTERLTAITNTSLLTCHLPYFADGSTNNHMITAFANVATKPFVPYDSQSEYTVGDHGGSLSLDGTGDYLDITTSAANLGTGDFTVECWTYWSADPRSIIYDTRQSNGASGHALFMTSTTHNVVFYDNNATVLTSAKAVKQGIWNHIAVVRNSGTINIFINGKKDTAQVTGNTTNFDAHTFRIGEKTYGGIPNVTGNITDFRISSTPRYTTDFTPATTPLASDGDTSLLLNMQGAKIFDKSQSVKSLPLSGNTTASTAQYKYLPTSMYFDGTGDYIDLEDDIFEIPANTAFTLEFWIKMVGGNSADVIFDWGRHNNADSVSLLSQSNGLFWLWAGGSRFSGYGSLYADLRDGTWRHFALSRTSAGAASSYIDGTAIESVTGWTQAVAATNKQFRISGLAGYSNYEANFYMSDLRITKGLARYTAAFTPPTAALQG